MRHATVLMLMIFGMASFVSYWLHATQVAAPLFSLRLFDVPSYRVGILGNLFSRIGSGSMPFLIPLLFQVSLGFSPLDSGMMMVPVALAGMVSKRFVVPLIREFGYRRVLVEQHGAGRPCDGELRSDLARMSRCGCASCNSPSSASSTRCSSPR